MTRLALSSLLVLTLLSAACSETQAAPETPPQDQQPSGNKTLGSAIKSLGGALQGSSAVHKTKELLDQVHGLLGKAKDPASAAPLRGKLDEVVGKLEAAILQARQVGESALGTQGTALFEKLGSSAIVATLKTKLGDLPTAVQTALGPAISKLQALLR